MGHSQPLFSLIFVFSIEQLVDEISRGLDSNLVSETTALPTEPQPLPLNSYT